VAALKGGGAMQGGSYAKSGARMAAALKHGGGGFSR